MTNSEHILNLFLAAMEAEVEAEHQGNDLTEGSNLDPLNDGNDCHDPTVPRWSRWSWCEW